MNSLVSQFPTSLERAWRHLFYDWKSRNVELTSRTLTIQFLSHNYDLVEKACRASNKRFIPFLHDAALQYARNVLETKRSGGDQ